MNKKPQSSNGKPHSSILEDYIRSKTLPSSTTAKATTITPSSSQTTLSEEPQTNQINTVFSEPSDSVASELLSMKQVFKENHSKQSLVNVEASKNSKMGSTSNYLDLSQANGDDVIVNESGFVYSIQYPDNMHLDDSLVFPGEIYSNTINYLPSDLYLSHLLNVAASSSSLCCDYGNQNLNMDCSEGKREMDLVEFISSSQFKGCDSDQDCSDGV